MKKQLDLGCGDTPRIQSGMDEIYGVDIAPESVIKNPHVMAGVDLAIQPIPFKDDEFDLVTAFDVMEHIPHFVYVGDGYNTKITKVDCMINLFNQIYRVLKPGGEFYFVSPIAGSVEYYRDPTHVYPWVQQSLHYFSGDYFGMHDHYGHRSKFELLQNEVEDGWRLHARLRAIKPDVPPYEPGSVT